MAEESLTRIDRMIINSVVDRQLQNINPNYLAAWSQMMPYIIKLSNAGVETLRLAQAAADALVMIRAYLARGYEISEIRDATRNVELTYDQLVLEADASRN